MKKLLIMGSLFLMGCGSQPTNTPGICAGLGPIGKWVNGPNGDTLTFRDDCTGSSSWCGSSFRFTRSSANPGTTFVRVTGSNGAAGCLPDGDAVCGFAYDAAGLAIDCGAGSVAYSR